MPVLARNEERVRLLVVGDAIQYVVEDVVALPRDVVLVKVGFLNLKERRHVKPAQDMTVEVDLDDVVLLENVRVDAAVDILQFVYLSDYFGSLLNLNGLLNLEVLWVNKKDAVGSVRDDQLLTDVSHAPALTDFSWHGELL